MTLYTVFDVHRY